VLSQNVQKTTKSVSLCSERAGQDFLCFFTNSSAIIAAALFRTKHESVACMSGSIRPPTYQDPSHLISGPGQRKSSWPYWSTSL
jgi:hypothetical protein